MTDLDESAGSARPDVFADDVAAMLALALPPASNLKVLRCCGKTLVGPDHWVDAVVWLGHSKGTVRIAVASQPDGQPRHVRAAAYRLESCASRMAEDGGPVTSLVVSEQMSASAQEICKAHGAGHLDRQGNLRLSCENVYVHRSHPDRWQSRPPRSVNLLFSRKATAVFRVLLRDPAHVWRVADIASAAHVSLGHASAVRKALLHNEWLHESAGGVYLSDPHALLSAWRNAHTRPYSAHKWFAAAGPTGAVESAVGGLREDGANILYALGTAAKWHGSHYLRDGILHLYADGRGIASIHNALTPERPCDTKTTPIALYTVEDPSVFTRAAEPVSGVACTSLLDTHLDLWTGNDREQEAAVHLGHMLLGPQHNAALDTAPADTSDESDLDTPSPS